jgi:parallel beta-helix repeat protein
MIKIEGTLVLGLRCSPYQVFPQFLALERPSMARMSSNGNAAASIVRTSAMLILCQLCSVAVFAQTSASCSLNPPVPVVPKGAKVYSNAPQGDNTAGMQSAIDALKPGDWLVFPAGTYRISKHLTVLAQDVTLYGQGAVIHSSSATDGALWIKADNVAVYGFRLEQDSSGRQTTPWAGGISVFDDRGGGSRTVHGATIQNNTINQSGGTGVFLSNVTDFTVANNTVWRSWADGIHMTGGSVGGRAVHNVVSQTGDDLIAVVSYAADRKPARAATKYANWPAVQAQLDRNIYIADNQVSDEYWGRGISVVGGSDVTIENNNVSRIPGAAAIYLTRETSYMTFGDHNILVRNNVLSQIQTLAPSYKPANINIILSGHGAIEVGSTMFDDESSEATYRDAFSMSDIALIGNKVSFARFAGIRLGVGTASTAVVTATDGSSFTLSAAPGSVRNVHVQNNDLSNVNSSGVIEPHPGLDSSTIFCADNTLNGTKWATRCTPTIAGDTQPPPVTGASLKCSTDGTLHKSPAPRAPTGLTLDSKH